MNPKFWKGRRVAVTGHTGFKGAWLCLLLRHMKADVLGFSLPPPTEPSLFRLAGIDSEVPTTTGDIRDTAAVEAFMQKAKPEIVLHMAAQSVVLSSYHDPVESFSTNVVGTASVLEAVRRSRTRCAIVNVTTDKVYANRGWVWGYRETDELGGNDPYSSSKACAELVAQSFRHSFFRLESYAEHGVVLASARAGNVVGGGDWTPHQLVPDAIAAFERGEPVVLRNPAATRPWQHVLDCISGYLTLAERLIAEPHGTSGEWNFGPHDKPPPTVSRVIEMLGRSWALRELWRQSPDRHPHEAHSLSLDSSKAEAHLGWRSRLTVEKSFDWVADWYKRYRKGESPAAISNQQISAYLDL